MSGGSAVRRAVAVVLDRAARGRRAIRDRRLIPTILAELVATGKAEAGWAVAKVHPPRWSPSGVTVVLVGPRGTEPRLAIKISHDDAGNASLAHERDIETELHADPRLMSWRRLVPEPIADGRASGMGYVVERAIPGQSAMAKVGDASARPAITAAAWRAILDLHQLTARRIRVDDAALARWVDDPLRVVGAVRRAAAEAEEPSATARLLHDRLRDSLRGREVTTARIHGDYWPANIILAEDGVTPAGIIDWDRSAANELPWHDVLHLVLFTRQMLGLPGLTHFLSEPNAQGFWTRHEEDLFAGTRKALGDEAPPMEILALIYWLRHTAATLRLNPKLGRDPGYAALVRSILHRSAKCARTG